MINPLFIILIGVILFFEIAMFVDMWKNEYLTDNEKLLWAFGMILIHPFVAILYYFTARTRH